MGLYLAVFIGLVLIQYVRKTAFQLNLGSMVVSSNYLDVNEIKKQAKDEPVRIDGRFSVFFGGMEFRLAEEEGLTVVRKNGLKSPLAGRAFTISDSGIRLELTDGSFLAFKTYFANGVETLTIQAQLSATTQELHVPFRPLRSSHILSNEKNRYIVAVGEKNYTFNGAIIDYQNKYINLKGNQATVAYGQEPEKKGFSPGEFVLASALDTQAYTGVINRWLTQAASDWERSMAGNPSEEVVLAYVSFAARKGNYRSATGTTPAAFLESGQRSYRSSAFFGRLDGALRGFVAADREYLGRLSRMINEKVTEILAEPELIRTLSVRGSKALVDELVSLVKGIDPSTLTPTTSVGVIENVVLWKQYRGSEENPFERLKEQALFVIAGTLKVTTEGKVLAFPASQGDLLFTMRLGNALVLYGTSTGLSDWIGLGKTLQLSALSLSDPNGSLPQYAEISNDKTAFIPAGEGRIGAARFYAQITGDLYYPRIEDINLPGFPGLWAWTAAGQLSATFDGSVLDITVPFLEGETHYMMIKGVKPFKKIQLYNIDFRTDPRFERYDSSGWAYSESEQTLLLKMKHRAKEEHIKIYYQVAEQ
ncbi:hypothetical protein Spica_2592 [Gracilinema caldarium DSM 7334]|uniref:Uncharacterized protein n=2 Tax=Gracilinema caldarium TaxID=215591 RepID=F8EY32_GRAC1|nr:hypothetical protein Spica_2592 [Gracilinema caldarium DSM 7334]